MSTSRRDIFTGLGLGAAAFALQLYSIGTYIAGRKNKCERHFEGLSAVLPSCNFLKAKGLDA